MEAKKQIASALYKTEKVLETFEAKGNKDGYKNHK